MFEGVISLVVVIGESSKIESRLSRLKSSYSKSFIPPLSIIPVATSMDLQVNLLSLDALALTPPHFFPSYVDAAVDKDEVIIAFNRSINELFRVFIIGLLLLRTGF